MSSDVTQQSRIKIAPRMNTKSPLNSFIAHSHSVVGISIRDDLKDSANGAVKTAVELLAVAASVTQNVPYLGAISGMLTEVIKIEDVCFFGFIFTEHRRPAQQEVKRCKEKWKVIIHNVESIKKIIDTYRNKFGSDDESNLNEAARAAFTTFERSV
jgi:hypothetical protein